jgi:hypothetical protein
LRLLGSLLAAGAIFAGPAVADVDDTFPPVITITVPTEGQVIASNQGALPTAFSCVDPEPEPSGVATCSGDATIDTTKHGDQQFIVRTSDNAGNATDKTVNYRIVDQIAPQITITAPVEGQHVPLHSTLSSNFDCTDAGGSLIDTCKGTQIIESPEPGPHVFTVLAIDGDGNRTTKSVNYVVDSTEGNVVHNPAGAQAAAGKALSASNSALKTLRRKRTATLAFTALARAKASVKVTARIKGKTVTIAKASGTAGGDGVVKLKLHVSGYAATAAMKHKGKLSLHVFVTITDEFGTTVKKDKVVSTRR